MAEDDDGQPHGDPLLDDLARLFATTIGPVERAALRRILKIMAGVSRSLRAFAVPASGELAKSEALQRSAAVVKSAWSELGAGIRSDRTTVAGRVASGAAESLETSLGTGMRRLSVQQLEQVVAEPWFGWSAQRWTDWHATNLVARVDRELRAGYLAGEGYEEIARRLSGATNVSRYEAMVTARTAIQSAGNSAARALYETNSDALEGVMYVATLDSRTCRQCGAYDGQPIEFPSPGYPPLHPQCRCFAAPWVGKRPKTTSWSDWIVRQSPTTQDAALGKSVGELLRAGEIEPDDLVGSGGRMRPVAELMAAARSD